MFMERLFSIEIFEEMIYHFLEKNDNPQNQELEKDYNAA